MPPTRPVDSGAGNGFSMRPRRVWLPTRPERCTHDGMVFCLGRRSARARAAEMVVGWALGAGWAVRMSSFVSRLMMRRRICRSTNGRGGIRFPTGDSRPRLAAATRFSHFALFQAWLYWEHREFNFVAGLYGSKEAPLFRVQFADLAD